MEDAVAISIEAPQLVQNEVEGSSNNEPSVAQSENTKEETSSDAVETLRTFSNIVDALPTTSNAVDALPTSSNIMDAWPTSSNVVDALPSSENDVETLPTVEDPEDGRISSETAGNAVAMEEEAENSMESNSSRGTYADTRNIENFDAIHIVTEGSEILRVPLREVMLAVEEEELVLPLPNAEISESDTERRRARAFRSIRSAAAEHQTGSRIRFEGVAGFFETRSESLHNGNGFTRLLSRFQSALSEKVAAMKACLGSLYNRFPTYRANARRNQDTPRTRSRSRSRNTRSREGVRAGVWDDTEHIESPIPEYEEMKCILTPVQLNQMNEALEKIPQHMNLFKVNCPVCHCRIHTYRVYSTVCGHLFCMKCLLKCLRIKPECPTCRRNLGPEDYHMVYI